MNRSSAAANLEGGAVSGARSLNLGRPGVPDGGLGERPDGPCGPRGALVLAAVEGFLKGRKACRAPQCAPLVPREGRNGHLLSDTGGCSSPCGTRHVADAGGRGAAGAVPGIKAACSPAAGTAAADPFPPRRTLLPASCQSGR